MNGQLSGEWWCVFILINLFFGDGIRDEEGENWFRAVLFSDTGKNCKTEDYLDALPEMLVGIELIDIQTED